MHLRDFGIPATLREFLDLLMALDREVCFGDVTHFYMLSRTCLGKDEAKFDTFDRAFHAFFENLQGVDLLEQLNLLDDWLRQSLSRLLSEEEKAKLKSLGGLDALLEALRQRLQQQRDRHEGGSHWIGTGGTSPFGAHGYHPEGIRMGAQSAGNRTAVKVWAKRRFADLDGDVELGTRNMKLALRRLRKLARTGRESELDLKQTIRATADNGGWLRITMVPERHNAVKVLLFLDIGGSMDDHVQACEHLFSAARSEFKHLEHYYFHNFVYEHVWKTNRRRFDARTSVWDLLHKYGPDYKVIFVGDAMMSPYEVTAPGGSIEHWNEEPGTVWFRRIQQHFKRLIWLNPTPQSHWNYSNSTQIIQELTENQMFGLTLQGIEQAMRQLTA